MPTIFNAKTRRREDFQTHSGGREFISLAGRGLIISASKSIKVSSWATEYCLAG
jgi:hypothetical protein